MICVYAWRGAMLFIPSLSGTGRTLHFAGRALQIVPAQQRPWTRRPPACSRRSAAPVINGESDKRRASFSQLTFILAWEAVAFFAEKSLKVMR